MPVGFNAHAMADKPYTIIVDGHGAVTERTLGDHDPGTLLTPTQVKPSFCGRRYQVCWIFLEREERVREHVPEFVC